jgi:hypothetical protein
VPSKNNLIIELSNPDYVPVIRDTDTFYGGSQMWFPDKSWYSKDYILHNYGCGTIATADMFLYLALQSNTMQSPETSAALQGGSQVKYENYDPYVRIINNRYTKTLRFIAVLGPKVASAINSYSESYGLGLKAGWKWKLTYYDMYDIIEEMLKQDIPVILAIGPNSPNLWGKKGIPFYERREIDYQDSDEPSPENKKPYYYKAVKHNINGHYVTVTGIIKDDVAGRIMLRISSWGKQYYINYEEYRDYVDTAGSTLTSSLIHVKKVL